MREPDWSEGREREKSQRTFGEGYLPVNCGSRGLLFFLKCNKYTLAAAGRDMAAGKTARCPQETLSRSNIAERKVSRTGEP